MEYDDFIVKIVRPEGDEEGNEPDFITSLSLTLWDFFLSLLSLGKRTYERVRVPFGVAIFGRPLPPYTGIKVKVNKWLREGRLPPFGCVFHWRIPDEPVKEGEDEMRLSWRKVEEKVGKSVNLKRRAGSGNSTYSLDLYNPYWEVELKVRSPVKSTPILKISAMKVYDLISRAMMRHKTPALLLKVETSPPRYYIVIPFDIVFNGEVYKVLGLDLQGFKEVKVKSFNFRWDDEGLKIKGENPPLFIRLANSMKFVVTETTLPQLTQLFQLNPLKET